MSDLEERIIAGLRVRIDRTLCVAFEDCIGVAPGVFRLNDDGVVTFMGGDDDVTRERLVQACDVCPVSALSLFTLDGVALLNA